MPVSVDPEQYLGLSLVGGAAAAMGSEPDRLGTYTRYGMTMWFTVVVDALPAGEGDLGQWSRCSGLQVDFRTSEVRDGTDYLSSGTLLPEHVQYQKITLERAMNKTDSEQVYNWLCAVQRNWMRPGGRFAPEDMHITLLNARQDTVMAWTLKGVVPVSWKCVPFVAGQGSIAIETLDLQHQGFLR
jgi:phage tail-like protein